MRYLFFFVLLAAAASTVSAQKIAGEPAYPAFITDAPSEKAIPDTLYHNFFDLDPTLYQAPVGGWMNGTNAYLDREKAQEVKFTQTYLLNGFIFWFALKDKNTGGDTSSVIFKLYKKDSVNNVNGLARLVPGTVMAADTVLLSDLNVGITFAAGLNYFALPQSMVMFQNYVAGFSMDLMHPRDTVALYGSSDTKVNITDYSWEKWNGKWNTIKNAWTLDIDFAIFPVIDLTGASINETDMNPVSIFPNPASHSLNISGTQANRFVILDAQGKTISTGAINASETTLDVSSLANGYYLIGLYTGDGMDAQFYRVMIGR